MEDMSVGSVAGSVAAVTPVAPEGPWVPEGPPVKRKPGRPPKNGIKAIRPYTEAKRTYCAKIPFLDKKVFDDVNNVPPIRIDEEGYAIRPWTPKNARNHKWTMDERRVLFLLMWNYSGGNMTYACQEAGITQPIADEWMKEPVFKARIDDALKQIADRLLLRLSQRVGLIRMPESVKVHDGALFGLVKKYRPEMFGTATGDESPAPAAGGIPRPRPD